MATLAEYNYVWVPIDRSFELDADRAYNWISQLLGIDYGFPVVLTGWIDTIQDNFPCMKDSNGQTKENICISGEFFELLFNHLDRKLPALAIVWSQAMNHRMNLTNAPLHQVYHKAELSGIKNTELATMPE